MNNHRNRRNLILFGILFLISAFIIRRHNQPVAFQTDRGLIFGTIYQITYQHPTSLKSEIEATLKAVDNSLSPFNKQSLITHINHNASMQTDSLFRAVFLRSLEISEETNGAFDITVAPLVNAWGFGFKKGHFPDSMQVDSLRQLVGYWKVRLDAENKVVKHDPRIMLNCSAVAKGFAVDEVARMLQSHGVNNLMVDIGGEVVIKGVNPQQRPWRIGINKPVDDSLSTNQELQAILELNEGALATSGNYRNYYYRDGKKYAHTVDPRTGYPVQHAILSSTVLAADCMSADAYATAFMVMGLEEAERFVAIHPELAVYFIYSQPDGSYGIYASERMQQLVGSQLATQTENGLQPLNIMQP